jgi:predicted permease
MHILRIFLAKCRALFRRNVVADEIREEMRFHVDMRAEELRARGVAPDAATRAASRRFGNLAVMQDRGYDERGASFLESIFQDLRVSARLLGRERTFSIIAIVTLALAIGASTALFSVIDAAILRPLPYPDLEQLVSLSVRNRDENGQFISGLSPSFDDLDAWRTSSRVFQFIGQARETGGQLIVEAGEAERLTVGLASADFLETLGVRPLLGRDFADDDTRGPAAAVALIGHAYWQRRFGGESSVLGRTIRVDGATLTVVGVLPKEFYAETAVWRPMLPPSAVMVGRRGTGTPTYARLRPGIEPGEASRQVTDLAKRIASDAGQRTEFDVQIESLYDDTVSRYGQTIQILSAAVTVILLIACINISGLLLARGATRQSELAIRTAIGAGRLRVLRQLLTESLVLSLAGGFIGAGLAWLLLDLLLAILPLHLPANAPPSINIQVLVFTVVTSVVAAVLFGLVPAIRLSHVHLGTRLAHASRRLGPALSRRGGQVLIAAEVTLAIVLLTGAGLLVQSFGKALAIDIGFEPGSYVTMEVFTIDPSPPAQRDYFARLLEAIRAIPGVSAAGAGAIVPLGNGGSYTQARAGSESVSVSLKEMSPGYIEAIGLAPIRGRLPTTADGPAIAVLSESGARRLFPTGNAVGNLITVSRNTYSILGVVRDIRSRRLLEVDSRPDVYLSFREDAGARGRVPIVFVRADSSVRGLADDLRRAAHAVGPPVIVERIRFGSEWVSDHVAEPRHRTLLIGLLGGLGLTLTLVGIFGVTAYTVARRTQEVGVRMAFGARPGQVVRAIVGDAAWPTTAGIALGLVGAYYATRLLETYLFETTPHDPTTFAAVALFMATTAIVAAWLPARRAARVDPVHALRAE